MRSVQKIDVISLVRQVLSKERGEGSHLLDAKRIVDDWSSNLSFSLVRNIRSVPRVAHCLTQCHRLLRETQRDMSALFRLCGKYNTGPSNQSVNAIDAARIGTMRDVIRSLQELDSADKLCDSEVATVYHALIYGKVCEDEVDLDNR